jgi:hypothetical protein
MMEIWPTAEYREFSRNLPRVSRQNSVGPRPSLTKKRANLESNDVDLAASEALFSHSPKCVFFVIFRCMGNNLSLCSGFKVATPQISRITV